MSGEKIALSVCAHPDDAEFMCAGTMALLRERGWEIHIATMTPGDCGSTVHSREEISAIRRREAKAAVKLLEGSYHCLECDDIFIMYDRGTLLKVVELLRAVRPTLVIAPSPRDYMVDHEMTSRLVQTACFSCGIKNVEAGVHEPYEKVPALYYVDPLEGKDILGTAIVPRLYVDISSVMELKEKMLCCHASQRDWLMEHHGMDEYVNSMKEFGQLRGKQAGFTFAEGFRQHRGHGFPQESLLAAELGELVKEKQD
jgi:LmbE family N-acetylglucosaminyl deacetylase